MKKFLHAYKLFMPDVVGGIPEVLRQIITAKRQDILHHLLVTRGRGWGRHTQTTGLTIDFLSSAGMMMGQPLCPQYPFLLRLFAQNADLLVLHLPFLWADISALTLPRRLPLVVHWHSSIAETLKIYPLVKPLLNHTLDRASKIIISDECLIEQSIMLQNHRQKCEVIPFGIDFSKWSNLTPLDKSRIEMLRARHPRMIVGLGRLVKYKGFDVLIRAMVDVDAELFIIGEGIERETLQNLIGALNLTHKVFLLGRCSEETVRDHLHAAQAFVFSSVSVAESFGIAQLEAMACGLPVVNTMLDSAVPIVARNGIESLTVPPRDHSALASAINLLLRTPEMAKQYGKNAADRVRNNFNQENFVAKTYALYDEVLKN